MKKRVPYLFLAIVIVISLISVQQGFADPEWSLSWWSSDSLDDDESPTNNYLSPLYESRPYIGEKTNRPSILLKFKERVFHRLHPIAQIQEPLVIIPEIPLNDFPDPTVEEPIDPSTKTCDLDHIPYMVPGQRCFIYSDACFICTPYTW